MHQTAHKWGCVVLINHEIKTTVLPLKKWVLGMRIYCKTFLDSTINVQRNERGCPSGLYTDYKNRLFVYTVALLIALVFTTFMAYVISSLHCIRKLHCLNSACTFNVHLFERCKYRWQFVGQSPTNETIAPTQWKVKTLKMEWNLLQAEIQKVVQLRKYCLRRTTKNGASARRDSLFIHQAHNSQITQAAEGSWKVFSVC